MNRTRYIFLGVTLACLGALWALFMRDYDTQCDTSLDTGSHGGVITTGLLPLNRETSAITLAPGMEFKLSTASTLSHITPATLKQLECMGCVADSSLTLRISHDSYDNLMASTCIYTVDLPIYRFRFHTDTATSAITASHVGDKPVAYLRNVNFVKAPGETQNVIGLDLIQKFKLEYRHHEGAIAFRNDIPETYDSIGSIYRSTNISEMWGAVDRFFIDMKVDHQPFSFLVNTSLADIPVKMPGGSDTDIPQNHRTDDIVTDSETVTAIVDNDAWVKFGNRAGSRRVYYYADKGTSHEMNPLVLFEQDLILDCQEGIVYMLPHFVAQRLRQ